MTDGPMELTSTQLEYVAWRAKPDRAGTKAQWARDHSVSDETLRRWEKTDWFREALEEDLRSSHLGMDSILEVIAGMQKKAAQGDTQAAKLYWQFVERVNPMRQHEVSDDLSSLSDEELDALLEGAID